MPKTRFGHCCVLRPLLTVCLALAALLFLPDAAPALQVHDAPGEGLFAHQMGHIYYIVALAFFFAYIRRSDFNERSWRYLQIFCILLAAWNLLSFAGHIAALHVAPADLVEFAINLDDARIPDNDGAAPVDVPIAPESPAAYFSTLPLRAMTAAALAAGVPAQISNTAGTFVCNCLMYSMLHFMARQASPVPCGFVHVPFLSGQGEPSLSPDDAVRGITAIMIIGWRNRSIIRLISLPNDRFGSE